MIALGWAGPGTIPPAPMRATQASGMTLLCAPVDLACTPRRLLELQVSCFDAGIDLLCFPPRSAPPIAHALEQGLAQGHRIRAALGTLRCMGQLAVEVDWEAPVVPPVAAQSGRQWLQRRRSEAQRSTTLARRAAQILTEVTRDLGSTHSTISTRADRCRIFLLLPRQDHSSILDAIARRARALDTPGMRLTATGLWPSSLFTSVLVDPVEVTA